MTFFAFLCAERLRGCCWAFAKEQHRGFTVFERCCDLLFAHLTGAARLPRERQEQLAQELDAHVPDSDEFGHPLSVQAQAGMLCLLLTLDTLGAERGAMVSAAGEAAATLVDALDNYEYFSRRALGEEEAEPREYELLDRELSWQRRLVEALVACPDLAAAAGALRLLNRSFAVPTAV